MIGKVPGTGCGFRGAFNYLMTGKRDNQNPDRVAFTECRNICVKNSALVPREMKAVASLSVRCKKPVYHFVISWREDENPSPELMRLVGLQSLKDLGLGEHQAVLAAHQDTGHKHLHILVNRVHPETGKAWHTGKDWERLEVSLGRQAKELGLLFVPGRHNTPEKMRAASKRPTNGDYQLAARTGQPLPPDRWSVDEIRTRRGQLQPLFAASTSWDQIHRLLEAKGLTLVAKGQGLVIADGTGYMKLSDLGKEIRLKGLEAAFGERFAAYSSRSAAERAPEAMRREATNQPPRLTIRVPGYGPNASSEDSDAAGGAYGPFPKARTQRHIAATEKDQRVPDPHEATLPHAMADEDKDLLREQLRLERIAAREAELAARQQRTLPPAAASEDSEAAGGAPLREKPRPTPAERATDPKSEAYARLSKANASLSFAEKLFAAGLINRHDLRAARRDVIAAQENLAPHLTLSELAELGLRDTLSPGRTRKPDARRESGNGAQTRNEDDRER